MTTAFPDNSGGGAVYRHFNKSGELLYVGVTGCAARRTLQHLTGSDWRKEIARIDVEWFESLAEAREAEALAIRTERPKCNRKGRGSKVRPIKPIAHQDLLSAIYAFMTAKGLSKSEFGLLAANDLSFVPQLEHGRQLRLETVSRIQAFMGVLTA